MAISPLRRFWAWLLTPPDEVLADAARDGEALVARVRTWLTLIFLTIPLFSLAADPAGEEHWVGLALASVALLSALLLERTVARGLHRPMLPYLTAVADVSIVSLGLLAFWLIDMPIVTVNSRVVFEIYLLAIAATSLRYSPQVCAVSGATAMVQYLLLSVLIQLAASPESLSRDQPDYGGFDWTTQIARLILLFGMTILALAIVSRTTRLRRQSTFDRLTGLFNRAYVEEYLGPELLRTSREGAPLIVAMLDVDKFKPFNDSYGHAAGDAALRQLAEQLRGTLRRSDVIARFGGEEIVVVMPGTRLPAALEKLEELRIAIGLKPIVLPRGGTGRITVSIGVAAYPDDGREAETLLDVADSRLYAAKEAGRNRVVAS